MDPEKVETADRPEPAGPSPEAIQSSLSYSIKDGAACTAMVGLGETFVNPAAALFLGANNFQIGLLSSLPQFAGAIFQVLSAEFVDRFYRRRLVYMTGALTQALTWIPMIMAVLLHQPVSIPILIAGFSMYMAAGNLCVPAWVSTMGDLVPAAERGRFFGRRNLIAGVAHVASMCAAGVFMSVMEVRHMEGAAFAILFVFSLLARLVSCWFLSRIADPPYRPSPSDYFSMIDFLRRAPTSNFARFVFFSAAMHFSVNIVGPFIAVYQLREIGLNYFQFMLCLVGLLLGMYLTMVFWGKLGDSVGNRRVMQVSSIGVALVPFMWLQVYSFLAAFLVHTFTGIVWAGFTMSVSNFIFDAATPAKRARCFAYFTFFSAMALFVGGTWGGILAESMNSEAHIGGFHLQFFSTLHWLMIISGIFRFMVILIFLPMFREVRNVNPISTGELVMRMAFAIPVAGWILGIFHGKGHSGSSSAGSGQDRDRGNP